MFKTCDVLVSLPKGIICIYLKNHSLKSLNIYGCKTMFPLVVYEGKLVLPKNYDVSFEKLNSENREIYLCS